MNDPLGLRDSFELAILLFERQTKDAMINFDQFMQSTIFLFFIVAGGNFDDSVGYFIEPTVVETSSKDARIFKEELFGPVVTAFVYKDADAMNIVNDIGKDTPYALTGAIYSEDQ